MIFPAIDLKDGQSVRLFKGDYQKVTLINEDPIKQAQMIFDSGVHQLHLVDLDGAKTGQPENLETIKNYDKNLPVSWNLVEASEITKQLNNIWNSELIE
jgi:Phosphoribosylformimino-5-aminoimidazole carboxamide ribonucleotide (ProFAR) isomerase